MRDSDQLMRLNRPASGYHCRTRALLKLISSVMTAPVRLAPVPRHHHHHHHPPTISLLCLTHTPPSAPLTIYTHTHTVLISGSHWCYVLGGCGGVAGGVHSETILSHLHLPYTHSSTKSFTPIVFRIKALFLAKRLRGDFIRLPSSVLFLPENHVFINVL